ncbi:MAG: hypothetical protein MI867_21970 [Pseudomonadales bacterium]|nr:hypothetical protein [Pseudomonadales bacterium]
MSQITLQDLKQSSITELDQYFSAASLDFIMSGQYRGVFIKRLDRLGARKPLYYVSFSFEFVPFGIDFDTNKWFFMNSKLQAGYFQLDVGPSRWRDTTAYRMHYEESEVPWFVKNKLYDEVKPLSSDLALGIGGVNRDEGGDHFYFALVRQ